MRFMNRLLHVMNGAVPDIGLFTKQELLAKISTVLTVILHLNLNHLHRMVFPYTAVEISNLRATPPHPSSNVVHITPVQ
jgi:hypothetical protein